MRFKLCCSHCPILVFRMSDLAGKTIAGPRPAASSFLNTTAVRNRRWDRACDVCRRRKSRCEIHDGANRCALCETNNYQCTFLNSSEPRKRRAGKTDGEEPFKKRYQFPNMLVVE